MLAFCENTYFADSWWSSLSHNTREHLTELAVNPNPYYSDISYLREGVVPWTFMQDAER